MRYAASNCSHVRPANTLHRIPNRKGKLYERERYMKWLWIILGTLAALVALVAIIGAVLPVKHVATKRARFGQPAEALWAAIDGPQDWRPGFGRYEALPERNGHKVWREDIGQGE